jgi:hypothetical protein
MVNGKVENSEQKLVQHDEDLKKYFFENKMELMNQSLRSTDETLKSMKQSISSIDDTLKFIKEEFTMMEKIRKLQFIELEEHRKLELALDCGEIASFQYRDIIFPIGKSYENFKRTESKNSGVLVANIIKWFRLRPERCYPVPFYAHIGSAFNDKSRKKFRDELKKQLTSLLPHEPRFEEDVVDKSFEIYFK